MPSQAMLTTKALLQAAAITTTTTGSAVDLQGSINPGGRNMKVFINAGQVSGTTASVTVTIMGGANTTVASMSSLYTFAAIVATSSNDIEAMVQTNNRYLAAVVALTANTTAFTGFVGVILENRTT